MNNKLSYSEGILKGFQYLLENNPEFFVIGQGLWSPWYVGTTMKDLDKDYGKKRIIDCPISEVGTTGAALGAALSGMKSLIVHPRMDFMLLAVDQIVTQAAKWRHMFGGKVDVPFTVRAIINRGGEQGAQHSQALHSWFAHIPGLIVVMPASANDARDLLISSVLSNNPVMFIDDRWLYEEVETEKEITIYNDLTRVKPNKFSNGEDLTIIGIGHTVKLIKNCDKNIRNLGVSYDAFDMRILNPMNLDEIVDSVRKTGRLLVIDQAWKNSGIAGEIIASVTEKLDPMYWKEAPKRLNTQEAPAPTSKSLEDIYYISENTLLEAISEFKLE